MRCQLAHIASKNWNLGRVRVTTVGRLRLVTHVAADFRCPSSVVRGDKASYE